MAMYISKQERIPHELYYECIIPHLFSDYLHQYFVYDKVQDWNPFLQLPLVCQHFHQSCRSLIRTKIFDVGLNETDAAATTQIRKVIRSTRKIWRKGRVVPLFTTPTPLPVKSRYQTLMSSQSLIQAYICAGYAKYFYTVDVLCPLGLDRLWITKWIDGDDSQDDPEIEIPGDFHCRPYKMHDDCMHRVFLPFTCAMVLCDSINHDTLASTMADYLARKSITYGTEPIILKHVQDLEMNIARRHGLPLAIWSTWTKNTLRLIVERNKFLTSLQASGKLVSQHVRFSDLSKRIIDNTRILDVLKVIPLVDWGEDTENIKAQVSSARESLLKVYTSGVPDPDESDEYFETGQEEPIFFSQLSRLSAKKTF